MFRRFLSLAVLLASLLLAGCMMPSEQIVRTESASRLSGEKIIQVTLTGGEVVNFDRRGARYLERYEDQSRVLVGRTEDGRLLVINLEQIRDALIESEPVAEGRQFDAFPTLIMVGLAVAVAVNGTN